MPRVLDVEGFLAAVGEIAAGAVDLTEDLTQVTREPRPADLLKRVARAKEAVAELERRGAADGCEVTYSDIAAVLDATFDTLDLLFKEQDALPEYFSSADDCAFQQAVRETLVDFALEDDREAQHEGTGAGE